MINIKQLLLRIFLLVEVIGFIALYFFSPYGLKAHDKEQKKIRLLDKDLDKLTNDIIIIEKEIQEIKCHDFYKEKIAREELQMSYPNETIYYLS